jgi:hypothetical protein
VDGTRVIVGMGVVVSVQIGRKTCVEGKGMGNIMEYG